MNREELDAVLKKHRMWLEDRETGERANLQGVNLRGMDLQGVNLRWANLQEANLQGANLQWANLQETDLRRADLQETDLRRADLCGAKLYDADFREANVDYSCWPLWCETRRVCVDVRIFRQLAMHLCGVVVNDDECRAAQEALMPLARKCHRADEFLGKEQK